MPTIAAGEGQLTTGVSSMQVTAALPRNLQLPLDQMEYTIANVGQEGL